MESLSHESLEAKVSGSVRKGVLTMLFAAVVYLCSACGGGGSGSTNASASPIAEPPASAANIFEQKTRKKFEPAYGCLFSKFKTLQVTDLDQGVDGTTIADEYAQCSAAGRTTLDIYLLNRSANGLSSFEKQISESPQPYVIGVDIGKSVSDAIDAYYANINGLSVL